MIRRFLIPALICSLGFAQQRATDDTPEAGPTVGLQLRTSFPLTNLKDVSGSWPGLGGSVIGEFPLEDGYAIRVGLGFDHWLSGDWGGRPGVRGQVDLGHLDLEGIMLLRPDEAPFDLGPYLIAGLSANGWSVTETDNVLGIRTIRRTVHLGGSFGLGWRIRRTLSAELKAFYGRVDPTFAAGGLIFAVTYHF